MKIKIAATKFRTAIEKCYPSLGVSFENFPRGSCGYATLLLGRYLTENDLGKFYYYLGDYGNEEEETWSSHAWLQAGDIVVDITADQFSDITEKVIVKECSEWHKLLDGKEQSLGDYRVYDASTVKTLNHLYIKIKDHI